MKPVSPTCTTINACSQRRRVMAKTVSAAQVAQARCSDGIAPYWSAVIAPWLAP